jgi:hypothetical protein
MEWLRKLIHWLLGLVGRKESVTLSTPADSLTIAPAKGETTPTPPKITGPESAPAAPDVPQLPLPTSPDTPIPATTEVSSDEDGATLIKLEEVQPTPFIQQLISNSIKDDSELPEASHGEPPITESRVPSLIPDVHMPASKPAKGSGITYKDLSESGGLTETTTADTTPAPLLLQFEEEPDAPETPKLPLPETEPTAKLPIYQPPIPPAPKLRTSDGERTPRSTQQDVGDLWLRVQLVFGRGGTIKTLALVPDKRIGMPDEVEVTGRQGESRFIELRDDCYEPVLLADASNALHEGIDWRGCGDSRRWRWVLSGRGIYVLAPGDEIGLQGFISTARLRLNTRHVILATSVLYDQVMAALTNAGCATPEVNDDNTPGVPSGWFLFRDVTPTRAVAMREERDIINVLCPAHEIEPHFIGGIRLERTTWLVGFPPRIRFTGELGDSFQVMIDGQPVRPAIDGAFEAPGWDAEGEHRLWFTDRTETYALRTMDEGWDRWNAHDFGTGVVICGAGIHRIDGTHWHQARIPLTNLLLIGARPGEIFSYQARDDVHSETILALVPFAPVWAFPINSVHADKRSARLVLLSYMEPTSIANRVRRDRNADRALREWVAAINDARRKHLALADPSEDAKNLWRRYQTVAKRLWKRMQ